MQKLNYKTVPMLFSTPMVEAILNGTKTETRRIVTENPDYFINCDHGKAISIGLSGSGQFFGIVKDGQEKTIKPKVNVNDIIWVRETFQITTFLHPSDENYGYIYKASENGRNWENNEPFWKWKPSLFMPKAACRIFLKCVSVHAERLQDIDEQSAINEGIEIVPLSNIYYKDYCGTGYFQKAVNSYYSLWQKINGKNSHKENSFVWVYKFQRIDEPHSFR